MAMEASSSTKLDEKQQLMKYIMSLGKELHTAARQLNVSGVLLSPRVLSLTER
jgi:hypothetical protein